MWEHLGSDGEPGAQIDLLIDREDAAINLCEMKFSESPFVVDKRCATDLRRKKDVFRARTKTRKSMFTTMVTTFGVAGNKHKSAAVEAELDMTTLFNP